MKTVSDAMKDVEQGDRVSEDLTNRTIQRLAWHKLGVTSSRRGSDSIDILSEVDGLVAAGNSINDPHQTILILS